jgi:pyrroline-5-carboxylate reductase
MRVGFVGAGKMASALAKGFLEGRAVSAATSITASCPEQDKHLLEDFVKLGCNTTHCNKSLVAESDVVILAVKPNVVRRVLEDVKPAMTEMNVLVSIAAGITLDQMGEGLNKQSKASIRSRPKYILVLFSLFNVNATV